MQKRKDQLVTLRLNEIVPFCLKIVCKKNENYMNEAILGLEVG